MNRLNDMTFSRDQNSSDNSTTSSWYVVNVSDLTMLCRKLNWKLLLARPNKTKTRNSNSHDDFHLVHHNFHACWYFYHPKFGRSLWVRENTAVNMRQSQSKLRFSILLLMLLLCRIYCNRMCVRQNAIRMFTKIYRNPLNGCVRQHAKETTRGVRFHLVCLRARIRKKSRTESRPYYYRVVCMIGARNARNRLRNANNFLPRFSTDERMVASHAHYRNLVAFFVLISMRHELEFGRSYGLYIHFTCHVQCVCYERNQLPQDSLNFIHTDWVWDKENAPNSTPREMKSNGI